MNEFECSLVNILGEWAGTEGEELMKVSGKRIAIPMIDNTHYETYMGLQVVGGEFFLLLYEDIEDQTPCLVIPFVPNKLGTIAATVSKFIEVNI